MELRGVGEICLKYRGMGLRVVGEICLKYRGMGSGW